MFPVSNIASQSKYSATHTVTYMWSWQGEESIEMLTNLMFPLGSLIELLPPHHQGLKKCLWDLAGWDGEGDEREGQEGGDIRILMADSC